MRKKDSHSSDDEKDIFHSNLILRDLVVQSLQSNGKTLNRGGDHTMALGTVSAFVQFYSSKKIKVIWIDAHPDANTRDSSQSGHYHGMPLTFLLGLDKDDKYPLEELFQFNELIYVGLRDVDPFEKRQVIDEHQIRCISIADVFTNPSDDLVLKFIGKDHFVYISWDVDSTDHQSEIP